MDDLISRQAAIEALKDAGITNYLATGDFYGIINALTVIKNMPTADLSEYSGKLWGTAYERGKEEARPKGNWIPIKNTRLVECECGFITDRLCEYNFCPNCGARMEEFNG